MVALGPRAQEFLDRYVKELFKDVSGIEHINRNRFGAGILPEQHSLEKAAQKINISENVLVSRAGHFKPAIDMTSSEQSAENKFQPGKNRK